MSTVLPKEKLIRQFPPSFKGQTNATLLANISQHCWMSHFTSVCTSCCMLLYVVGSCCTKFETGQTNFEPTTPNISFVLWSPKHSTTMLLDCEQSLRMVMRVRKSSEACESRGIPPLSSFPVGQFTLSSPAYPRLDWLKRDCSQSIMLYLFAQLLQHCISHTCALPMVFKVSWIVSFPWCSAGPNIVAQHYQNWLINVGSCCIRLHIA